MIEWWIKLIHFFIIVRRTLEIASAVKQTFESIIKTELFARSQIDIYIQILQFDGGKFMEGKKQKLKLWFQITWNFFKSF